MIKATDFKFYTINISPGMTNCLPTRHGHCHV